MADLAELKLPVFLPGSNRDWVKVDGVAQISDTGEILVRLKPEDAKFLVELAKQNILMQLSFDYRMDAAMIEKIIYQNKAADNG